jgi:hypothetical protein
MNDSKIRAKPGVSATVYFRDLEKLGFMLEPSNAVTAESAMIILFNSV